MEMDRKIQEAFENLSRTRDCISHQLMAEEMTLETMTGALTAEAQIYKNFAADLIQIADEVLNAVKITNIYHEREINDSLQDEANKMASAAWDRPVKYKRGRPRKTA